MKINLRTFEFVALFMFVLGIVCALWELEAVRAIGYLLTVAGAFLFFQAEEERKRRRRRNRYKRTLVR